jgi:hypothetical protein
MRNLLLFSLMLGSVVAIAPARSGNLKADTAEAQYTVCCYYVGSGYSTPPPPPGGRKDRDEDRDKGYAISNVFRSLPCGPEYDRRVLKYVYGVIGPQKNKIQLYCSETREKANQIRQDILDRMGTPRTVWSIPDGPISPKQKL